MNNKKSMNKFIALAILLFIANALPPIQQQFILKTQKQIRQGELNFNELEESLKSSHIGKIVLTLTQMKGQAKDFDFSKLYGALDSLEEGIRIKKERIAVENDSFQQYALSYSTDTSYYSNQITDFGNQIANFENEIADLVDTQGRNQQSLNNKAQEKSETLNLIDRLRAEMKKNKVSYEGTVKSYDEAVESLEEALQLLQQASEGSLIQVEKSNTVADKLKTKIKSLNQRRIMFKPLLSAFTQLSSTNFENSVQLQKLFAMISDLRQSLVKSRLDITNNYESELESNNEILGNYESRVNLLINEVLPELQKEIQEGAQAISSLNSQLNDAQTNLKAAQDNLKLVEDRWIQRNKQSQELLEEYNAELVVKNKATEQLQRAGIKRN